LDRSGCRSADLGLSVQHHHAVWRSVHGSSTPRPSFEPCATRCPGALRLEIQADAPDSSAPVRLITSLVMLVSDFDYYLPERLIPQEPADPRDRSRLLVLDRSGSTLPDSTFHNLLSYLRAGDVLVLNNTRVFPARLIGNKVRPGQAGKSELAGRVEVFLVR